MYEEGLKKTGRNIVLAIFAIIVGILTFLSMFLNTYISIEERTTIINFKKRLIIEKCLYEFVLYS